jgi:putative transposase
LILARWVPNWKHTLQIIKPDTRLRWHREGLRLFWKSISRVPNLSNRLGADTVALIQRMARENPLWGAECIRGELLKLGTKLAKRTI